MLRTKNIMVNNILNDNDIAFLKSYKDKKLDTIYVDYFVFTPYKVDFDFITHVLFDFGSKDLLKLENEVIDEKADHDEYSNFKVTVTGKDIFSKQHKVHKIIDNKPEFDRYEKNKWYTFNIGNNIQNIKVYRDNAIWNYDGRHWDVTTDVAIHFSGSNFKFLCLLHDSIDSSMSVFFNYKEDEDTYINQYWSKTKWGMKCENVELLNRKIIVL